MTGYVLSIDPNGNGVVIAHFGDDPTQLNRFYFWNRKDLQAQAKVLFTSGSIGQDASNAFAALNLTWDGVSFDEPAAQRLSA